MESWHYKLWAGTHRCPLCRSCLAWQGQEHIIQGAKDDKTDSKEDDKKNTREVLESETKDSQGICSRMTIGPQGLGWQKSP